MPDDVLLELRRRITDPEELAKFERFAQLFSSRMTELGRDAGVPAMMDATRSCWLKAFGVEWPATKAPAAESDR